MSPSKHTTVRQDMTKGELVALLNKSTKNALRARSIRRILIAFAKENEPGAPDTVEVYNKEIAKLDAVGLTIPEYSTFKRGCAYKLNERNQLVHRDTGKLYLEFASQIVSVSELALVELSKSQPSDNGWTWSEISAKIKELGYHFKAQTVQLVFVKSGPQKPSGPQTVTRKPSASNGKQRATTTKSREGSAAKPSAKRPATTGKQRASSKPRGESATKKLKGASTMELKAFSDVATAFNAGMREANNHLAKSCSNLFELATQNKEEREKYLEQMVDDKKKSDEEIKWWRDRFNATHQPSTPQRRRATRRPQTPIPSPY